METEVTMILIDNSSYVPVDSDVFKTQLEAIRLYCRAKNKSNPKFHVGLATMGCGAFTFPTPPSSDVEQFLSHTLEHISWGGELAVPGALQISMIGFSGFPEYTKRRMLVSVAGPGCCLMDDILKIGKHLKETNIALDVVCFAHEEDPEYDAIRKKNLRSFVDAANKGNNSHFAHVPRRSSPRTFLVSSNILTTLEAQAVPEEEMNKEMSQKKNKKKKNRTRRRTLKNHHSQDDLDKHSQEDLDKLLLVTEQTAQGNMADNHHNNQPNPGYVFVMGKLGNDYQYNLIVDDDTFPENRETLTPPDPLRRLTNIRILNPIGGYQCFYGDDVVSNTKMVVMWNPTNDDLGPAVFDVTPNEGYTHSVVGFGVCPVNGPKLVNIRVMENFDGRPTMWDVNVITLSTGHGINVYTGPPFRSCKMECAKVCVNGVIYFRAYDLPESGRLEDGSNFFISFDLASGEFGEVPLPENLEHTRNWIQAAKVNGSLGLLEYHDGVCDLWTKGEGANEMFILIHTIRAEGQDLYGDVLGFRNNGQVVVGIAGNRCWYFVSRSIETPLIIDQRDSIIYSSC